MQTSAPNPCQYRLSTLLSLETEQVHDLACWALGTLTAYRLILGRCLLALHESKGFKDYGCSTAVHYGTSVLGVSAREARESKRVAGKLRLLPRLTIAAERGKMPWTKLRELVRVASAETEEYWIKLAADKSSEALQKLVSRTPEGQLPGDADLEKTCTSEFRLSASPEVIRMFRQVRRVLSTERDKAVTGAETLEWLIASYYSTQILDPEVVEKVRQAADKDLQAERAREVPEIMEAREMAADMGLLFEAAREEEEVAVEEVAVEDLLAQAIGAVPQEVSKVGYCSLDSKRERPGVSEQDLFQRLSAELNSWKNKRLRFNPNSRHTTKAQRQEILRREAWKCLTPACPNVCYLEIHHIKPYSEDGDTTELNCCGLCAGCHRNVHEGLLKITPSADGKLIFDDRKGRRLDKQADLEMAAWLDLYTGWRGGEHNSHKFRALSGDWSVFAA